MGEAKQIYVAKNEYSVLVKVGATSNASSRMQALSHATGGPMKLLYETHPTLKWSEFESTVHRNFISNRTCGEWFDIDPQELIDFIKELEQHFIFEQIEDPLQEYRVSAPIIEDVFSFHSLQEFSRVSTYIYRDQHYVFYIDYEYIGTVFTIRTESLRVAKQVRKTLGLKVKAHKH